MFEESSSLTCTQQLGFILSLMPVSVLKHHHISFARSPHCLIQPVVILVRTIFLDCTSRVEKSSVTILHKKYNFIYITQIFKKCCSLSFEPSGHAVLRACDLSLGAFTASNPVGRMELLSLVVGCVLTRQSLVCLSVSVNRRQ